MICQCVDLPVIVKRPSGDHDPNLTTLFSGALLTQHIGSRGWADAVMHLLDQNV